MGPSSGADPSPHAPGSDDELLALADRIAAQARPGEEVEAFVSRGTRTTVKAFGGQVESLTTATSAGVGIRVVRDRRQGFAHCGTLDQAIVAATLDDARDNAAFGEPDEWAGLARPDGVAAASLDLRSPALAGFPVERKVELALELEALVLARDPRIRTVRNATYGDGDGAAAVATSTGLRAVGGSNWCQVAVSALAADGDETRTGVGVDVGRDPEAFDLAEVADDAVRRAVRLFGAKKVPSQPITIVLEPRLAATLLGIFGGMLTGERVLKGRTPFADRLGQAIAAPCFTLVDDPTDPRSLGADPHDGEGLATRRNLLVEGGVLQGFLHNATTGRRAGTGSTGSAVRGYRSTPGVGAQALALAPGAGGDLDQLIAGVGEGLLVQSLSGLHSGVNAVSGDFSVGAEGLMIRAGEVAEPVREVTLASTLQRMLLDVRAVGSDLGWQLDGTGTASLVVGGLTLSGS
jgi:PmbA protein